MIDRTIIRRAVASIIIVAGLAPHAVAQNTPENAARITALRRNPVVIRGGWLFTGTSDTVVRNEEILIVAGRLLALMECASLLISNNTGPAHVAAALGTPVVDLYAAQFEAFEAAVAAKQTSCASGHDGLKSVALAAKILNSARREA